MAKNITRRDFLKTAALGVAGMTAAGFLGGCSTTGNSAKTGTYTPGTYSATATGMATIKVTATFPEFRSNRKHSGYLTPVLTRVRDLFLLSIIYLFYVV